MTNSRELLERKKTVYISQASLNYPFGGNETLQMHGKFEGFPIVMTPVSWVAHPLPSNSLGGGLMSFVFQTTIIFRFHVSFRRCNWENDPF